MTIIDTVLARRSARQHLLWVVVALSLALNLFFVAGALWTRFHVPPVLTREERFDEMATALALDPQQRQEFARYSTSLHGQLVEMHNVVAPLMHAAWAEVAKPHADEVKVMQLLDQAAAARHGYLKAITSATIVFLKNLSAEQRAKFVKVSHQGPPPWALNFPRQRPSPH